MLLIFGKKLVEMTSLVNSMLKRRKHQAKIWYDKSAVQRSLIAGDEVLILLPLDTKKMAAQRKGPFYVVERVNDKVNVSERRGSITYHFLKKYTSVLVHNTNEREDTHIKLQQLFPYDSNMAEVRRSIHKCTRKMFISNT